MRRQSANAGQSPLGCILVSLIFLACSGPVSAQITADQVRESIRRGVDFIKQEQNPKTGGWTDAHQQPGGVTSLCVLALLNAGESPDDPSVAAALDYLRKLGNPKMVYATSLQTMVFCVAEPEQDRLLIRRNAEWLESAQVRGKPTPGGWSYSAGGGRGSPDQSNSQFAVLALHEAQQVGVFVSPKTWELAARYWHQNQRKDGSWGYRTLAGSGSMTCAGLSSLLICAKNLLRGDAAVKNGRVLCCGRHEPIESIELGFRWLDKNFSVRSNPSAGKVNSQNWYHYYMYGLERVGRMGGRRFIGDHDWYREGAEVLVDTQDKLRGFWMGSSRNPTISTALSVLFLSKGRRPVVVSKLQHSLTDNWARHRSDIANLTPYVERLWKRPLTWQTINFDSASVEDLLQTPVLFISASKRIALTEMKKRMLKKYVDQGGFLFVESCCDGGAFDEQFRKLMAELFPDAPLRLLPPDHPVWHAQKRIDKEFVRPLYGLETCCRTSVVYCPDGLGCYWELAKENGQVYPEPIRREIENVLGIGANVLAYATGRELRDKLDMPVPIASSEEDESLQRGSLYIGKLQHGGGSDDAPAALVNLLRIAQNQAGLRVSMARQLLSPSDAGLPDYPLLFIHGRRAFRWSVEDRKGLSQFVKNGGIIFGDAICASKPFADAFRSEMQEIFPDSEWKRVPNDHELFTDEFRGFELKQVRLRKTESRQVDRPLEANIEEVSPVLEGLEIDGNFVVLFSPFDISCAMENHASLDCTGYVAEDAARLGINIILYALQQ
jgi:hypothetical protein